MTAGKNRSGYNYHRSAVLSLIIILFSAYSIKPGSAENSEGEGFRLPGVKSVKLANGIKLFFIREDLPKITIAASVGYGKLYEKRETAGLSNLIAKTLSLSGSKQFPGNRLHERIESIGGKFSVKSSWETTTISVSVLKRYSTIAFEIVSDILKNPNFSELYIKTAKSLVIDSIRRNRDKPDALAFNKIREIIFNGEGYGAVPDEKNIGSFNEKIMADTWKKYFHSENVIVGISSISNFDTIQGKFNGYFSKIPGADKISYSVNNSMLAEKLVTNSSKIYLIPKNIPQSTIVVGTLAPDIHNSGNYSLAIMNYILGGGSFNSRLMREIRVKRGLAYVVHSVLRFKQKTGVFLGYAQTNTGSTGTVLSLLVDNINKMQNSVIPDEEINWAKQSIYNSFIFRFDTPMSIINNKINIEYYNLPENYYEKYLSNIRAVTGKDILSESRNLVRNGIIKLVVGKRELAGSLGKFGKVVILE